ncbi:MAG: murein biosynthesis integral membrane protein MurJ [Geminicoccaceae bacterium]
MTACRYARSLARWRSSDLNRGILSALLTVGAATIALKLAAVGRELAVAYQFGTSDALDAFIIAFLPASFAINVQIAAFSAALMPTFIRMSREDGHGAARQVAESTLLGAVVMLIATSLLLLASDQWLIGLLTRGFSPEKRALTIHLFHLVLPVILLQGLVKFYGTLINARHRFGLVAAVPMATPLLTMGLLVVIGRPDPSLLVLGVVVGAAIELALLLPLARRLDLLVLPRWHGFDPPTRRIVMQYFPIMVGALTGGTALMIDQGMAAMLGPGSVATLSYGGKLIALLLAFTARPLSAAILPFLADLAATDDGVRLRQTFYGWLGLLVSASLPIVAAIWLLSTPIVRLMFERGAFTAEDTAVVALIQGLYALQIPFYLAGALGSRVLNALSLNRATAIIGILNCVANIVFDYLFMRWLGLPGIALATSAVYLCSSVVILAVVQRHLSSMCRSQPLAVHEA